MILVVISVEIFDNNTIIRLVCSSRLLGLVIVTHFTRLMTEYVVVSQKTEHKWRHKLSHSYKVRTCFRLSLAVVVIGPGPACNGGK